jgi:4-hydroxyphenylacetate 3-monooxygenase oxygenase component
MPATTGEEFVERLRDSRTVYYKGEQIDDVTEHPVTRDVIHTQAELFDLQHDEEYRDLLTYESPETGERESVFYKLPTSVEDLEERRRASRVWHDYTCGMAGRASDFMASGIVGLEISRDMFVTDDHHYGEHIHDYYQHCRDNDLCLTHALVDPQIDRSKSSATRTADDDHDRPGALRKVEEYDDGIVVSGARMLATLGPQADELVVYPFGFYDEGEDDKALMFAVPIETEGLRLICRPSFAEDDERNHPISGRMDEMDVFVVFDDVFVPEDRVFVNGDVELANNLMRSAQPGFATHQTLVTDLSKTEFALGVALALAESTGIDQYFHVQAKLGEIIEMQQLLESSAMAMEAKAEEHGDTGYVVPDFPTGLTALSSFAEMYQRVVQIIRDLGGSGLIGVPAWEDLEADEPLGGDVETYFRGKDMPASERLGIQKLAHEVAVSGLGSREAIYERFHVSGPMRVKTMLYKQLPVKEQLKQKARENGLRHADAPGVN